MHEETRPPHNPFSHPLITWADERQAHYKEHQDFHAGRIQVVGCEFCASPTNGS